MSAVSGIWNSPTAPQANPLMSTKAMDDTSSSSGTGSNSGDTTISANDFLTLLVTEMQNQDPTADTDPNEYIDQLVNVNSLEQLININQTLSTALTPASSDSTAAASTSPAASNASSKSNLAAAKAAITPPTNGPHTLSPDPTKPIGHPIPVQTGGPVRFAQGNLSSPSTGPSALRVARSLDGQRITR
jgi:flagellar basal-body rod modification protein FlgD